MKDYLKDRFIILKSGIIDTFYNETAYWHDNWLSVLSTLFYTITYLAFIDILFKNTNNIAGYSQNDMLVFFFIFECAVMFNGNIMWRNIVDMIIQVNKGEMDLVFTKPIPHLFYVSFRRISILSFLRDGVPVLLIIASQINWQSLNLTWQRIIPAIIVFLFGMISIQVFLFLSGLVSFWYGEAENFFGMAAEMWGSSGGTIPFEGLDRKLQLIFTFVIPSLIPGAISASVLLGKSDALTMVIISAIIAVIMLKIKGFFWNLAIKNYTSASS